MYDKVNNQLKIEQQKFQILLKEYLYKQKHL